MAEHVRYFDQILQERDVDEGYETHTSREQVIRINFLAFDSFFTRNTKEKV